VAGIICEAIPSRTGMLQSMRMQSNGGYARAACTAASPLSTTVHRTPARSSMRCTIFCEGMESSAYRMRRPRRASC